ncbi:MAG: AAA family ATPase [Phycisphaerae bacterium]|nr:AAA family ATPase [Phycisphaerae bacterium]
MHTALERLTIVRRPVPPRPTPRLRQVRSEFGLDGREAPLELVRDLTVRLDPRRIIAVVGPSGAGKTALLGALAARYPRCIHVRPGALPSDRAVVDLVAPRRPLRSALAILTGCGLGEPRLWVRRARCLSDGERFRAALARAIGAAINRPAPPVLLCDEFSALLHRRAARAIAYNLRRLVSRAGLTLVVATAHDDVLADLQPDLLIRLDGHAGRIIERTPRPRPVSLRRRVRVEPGSVAEYARFAAMHYRQGDGLGFVDRVFVLRDGRDEQPLGIAVFAMPPIESAVRNAATGRRFCCNPRRLNREMRILRRLVIHPDARGCGLGHWFVRRILPLAGTRFVECLAAMGSINPVLERAGMHRIGRAAIPRGRWQLLQRLRKAGIDPISDGLPEQIRRSPRVRRLVEATIADWMRATSGSGRRRLRRAQAAELARAFRQLLGEPPVYYLWDREGEFPRRRRTPDNRFDGRTVDHGPHADSIRSPRAPRHEADEVRRHSPATPARPNQEIEP